MKTQNNSYKTIQVGILGNTGNNTEVLKTLIIPNPKEKSAQEILDDIDISIKGDFFK